MVFPLHEKMMGERPVGPSCHFSACLMISFASLSSISLCLGTGSLYPFRLSQNSWLPPCRINRAPLAFNSLIRCCFFIFSLSYRHYYTCVYIGQWLYYGRKRGNFGMTKRAIQADTWPFLLPMFRFSLPVFVPRLWNGIRSNFVWVLCWLSVEL